VQIALDLNFSVVSIVPDIRDRTLGFLGSTRDDRISDLRTHAREAAYLRYAMVCYAGAEAIRQLIPTHPNPDAGASTDRRRASNFIRHRIGGEAKSTDLLFSLAKRRCALLVEHYQPEIKAVAGALQADLILSAKAARRVFMRSLTKRSGRVLTFEADPTLKGVAGEEAFRDFLRRLNLPGRSG
jgi:hypothetical protein